MQYVEAYGNGDKGQEYSNNEVIDKAEGECYGCPKGEEYTGFDFAGYGFVFLEIFYICSQNLMGKQFLVQAFAAFQKTI